MGHSTFLTLTLTLMISLCAAFYANNWLIYNETKNFLHSKMTRNWIGYPLSKLHACLKQVYNPVTNKESDISSLRNVFICFALRTEKKVISYTYWPVRMMNIFGSLIGSLTRSATERKVCRFVFIHPWNNYPWKINFTFVESKIPFSPGCESLYVKFNYSFGDGKEIKYCGIISKFTYIATHQKVTIFHRLSYFMLLTENEMISRLVRNRNWIDITAYKLDFQIIDENIINITTDRKLNSVSRNEGNVGAIFQASLLRKLEILIYWISVDKRRYVTATVPDFPWVPTRVGIYDGPGLLSRRTDANSSQTGTLR